MVRIRLRRVGARKQASFRIVVADSRSPRDGRFIESIGFYNPRTEPETVKYDEERALYWLSVGAQPSEAVARMLEKGGTLARAERLKAGEPMEELLAEAAAEAQPTATPETDVEPDAEQVEEEALEEEEEEDTEAEAEVEVEVEVEAEEEEKDTEAEVEAETAEENVEAPDQGAEEADS